MNNKSNKLVTIGMTTRKTLPRPLCKWWMRFRPCKHGIQLNNDMLSCMEFYVPWWAWLFELVHRAIFGYPKLIRTQIEGIADGKTRKL